MAMGRSKPEPSFLMSAGARLMVMRVGGRSKPEFLMAERTRSRDSRTAASGRPTVEKVSCSDDAGEVDFDIDDVGVDAVDGGAAGFEEHVPPGRAREAVSGLSLASALRAADGESCHSVAAEDAKFICERPTSWCCMCVLNSVFCVVCESDRVFPAGASAPLRDFQ